MDDGAVGSGAGAAWPFNLGAAATNNKATAQEAALYGSKRFMGYVLFDLVVDR